MNPKIDKLIDLVCNNSNNKPNFSKPWLMFNGETVVTNSRILIFFNDLKADKIDKDFEQSILELDKSYQFKMTDKYESINHKQEKWNTCTTCNGTGKIILCPECNGEGTVLFEFEGYYTSDGIEDSCPLCKGKGTLTDDISIKYKIDKNKYDFLTCLNCTKGRDIELQIIMIGKEIVDNQYVHLLNTHLSDVTFLIREEQNLKAIPFIHSEGRGFVMPRNS